VRPTSPGRRQHRFEIDERIGADAGFWRRSDVRGVEEAGRRAQGCEDLGRRIMLLKLLQDPAHELQAKEVLQRALPELFLCWLIRNRFRAFANTNDFPTDDGELLRRPVIVRYS